MVFLRLKLQIALAYKYQNGGWHAQPPGSNPAGRALIKTTIITANIYSELWVGLMIFLFPKMSRRLKNVKAPPLNVDTKVTVD